MELNEKVHEMKKRQFMRRNISLAGSAIVLAGMLLSGCGSDPAPAPQGEGSLLVYTFLNENDFEKIELFVDGILQGTLTERVDGSMPCTTETSAFAVKIRLMAAKKYNFEAKRYLNGNEVGSWESSQELKANTCQRVALK